MKRTLKLSTYRKYKTREDAIPLIEILELNDIEFLMDDISPTFDISFSGGNAFEDQVALKLKPNDFERVEILLNKIAEANIDLVDKDHYLFDFSNEELFEVLENYDEWGETDLVLSKKILIDRGQNITDAEILKLREEKNEKLRKPEEGRKWIIVAGYISSALAGPLGIIIGYHHFKFKKTIATGEKVYAYDTKTRKSGLNILYIGLISVGLWILMRILSVI